MLLGQKSLAARIMKAEIFEDIFSYGSENEVRKQYDLISEQLEQIDLVQNNPVFAAEVGEKLRSLYCPVITNFETHNWAIPSLPEINYFELVHDTHIVSGSVERTMKEALNTKYLRPLSILDFLETKEGKSLFALGKQCCSNIEKYGYANWYDWRIANWGTKWNAYETFVDWDAHQIFFQTAWSAPEPVIHALHEAFPGVEFEWLYADEDCGHNIGIAVSENGGLTVNEVEDCSPEAYEIYVNLWGTDDCMYQDEAGRWGRYNCDDCPHPCG